VLDQRANLEDPERLGLHSRQYRSILGAATPGLKILKTSMLAWLLPSRHPRRALPVALCLTILAAGGTAARAEDQAIDATTCAKCHGDLGKRKVVHPAFTGDNCLDCHAPADKAGKCKSPLAKGWKLKSDEPGLCRDCHPNDSKTPLHPVIDSMGCTPCHDPHSSDTPHLLKAANVGELCKTCHDVTDGLAHPHTPVKLGQCTECHDPHTSPLPKLLKAKPDALCGKCHKPEKLLPNRYRHAPVLDGACTQCHAPHGSKFPNNTLAEAGDLCMKCHDAKAPGGIRAPRGVNRIDLKKKTVHPAIDAGGCTACHVAGHSAAMPKLLQKRPVDLCYDCHDRKDNTPFVHGAVRLGDCAVCHEPHSSDIKPLLRKEKPADTCFLCHSDDATSRAFVHRPVAEGQCTACHSPHGAKDEFSIKRGWGRALCFTCHKKMDAGKNKHPALERNGCTFCHDPHASDNPFFMSKPVNEICQSCHTDKTDGKHVTSFLPKGHKILGGADPHNIDKDFTCASCHNPHGSDSPKLLRFGEGPMEVCDYCHGDRLGKHPELKDVHLRKRTDKNVDDYRKEVPSPLLPGAWPGIGAAAPKPDTAKPAAPATAAAAASPPGAGPAKTGVTPDAGPPHPADQSLDGSAPDQAAAAHP
jgi:predicted CXXCH cytochrome family protein